MKKISDIADELGIYIKTINDFFSVVEPPLHLKRQLFQKNPTYIGGYQEIKDEVYSYLKSFENEFREFKADHYREKSVQEISSKINIPEHEVITILNTHWQKFFPLYIDLNSSKPIFKYENVINFDPSTGVNHSTRIFNLSSYKILKIIRDIEIFDTIKKQSSDIL